MAQSTLLRIASFAVGVSLAGAGCGATSSEPAVSADQMAYLCAGVADAEAQNPSFLASSSVNGVRPFMGERHYIKFTEPELRGADIDIRSTPGMTRQWLTRVLRCHVARRSVQGPQDGVADPFVVGTPDLLVLETDTGFVVRVAGRDRADGVEILRRAKMLVYGADAARN